MTPKQGYIYIGGFQPHPEILYIKAGKTNRPKERVRDYGTMIPGGLTFMRAARVDRPTSAETQLMTALSAIEGVEAVGGEWFRCHPFLRLTVLDTLHEIGHSVVQIHTCCPGPFGVAAEGKRAARGRNRRG